MEYLQRLNGRGGWPLNVFTTPERIPFWGGTYFPPARRGGMPSWLEVVDGVCDGFRREGARIRENGENLARELAGTLEESPDLPSQESVAQGLSKQILSLDPVWGGFPGTPKFPPHAFLASSLAKGSLQEDEAKALRTTLDRIAQGGIRDHVGGGFARYSTDEKWLVPHFEKMLYDNAQLLGVYAQAAAVFQEPRYAQVVRDTALWMRRELGDPEGGFRSALDADSEGEEGAYYVWTWDDLADLFGQDLSDFAKCWNCTPAGNFEDKNVLWRTVHEPVGGDLKEDSWRSLLFTARQIRERPGLDDKVLASWNGLAIAGLAISGARLGDKSLLDQARGIAQFVRTRLRHEGGLWSVWKNGQAKNPGTLEDWAFVGDGLLELWQATGESHWLMGAIDAARQILTRFANLDTPVLRFSDKSRTDLFANVAPLNDNATPSGNGVAARLFAKLHLLTGDEGFRIAAERILLAAGDAVARFPRSYASLLDAWRVLSPGSLMVHLGGDPTNTVYQEMKAVLQRGRRIPDLFVLGSNQALPGALQQGFVGEHPVSNTPTAWICRGTECLEPITSAEELRKVLAES